MKSICNKNVSVTVISRQKIIRQPRRMNCSFVHLAPTSRCFDPFVQQRRMCASRSSTHISLPFPFSSWSGQGVMIWWVPSYSSSPQFHCTFVWFLESEQLALKAQQSASNLPLRGIPSLNTDYYLASFLSQCQTNGRMRLPVESELRHISGMNDWPMTD